jgi:hypothetical protein
MADLKDLYDVEIRKLEHIYSFSKQKIESKLQTKAHLENKCMNLLQASAVLITLFVGIMSFKQDITLELQSIIVKIEYAFFLTLLITIITLLLSLDDSIANWYKREKEGLYEDTKKPSEILNLSENDMKHYFENMIKDFSKSIESVDRIMEKKNKYFNRALRLFILSLIVLVLMGTIIA